ncbi:nucleotide sugar dehydrogenase [Saccharopolyspora erythraea]|uniref:nucleotide sugar dehydrogenase n=1 Tax=Saccharopolyspora erythraea TaxID=1836 RepID=UPI001BA7598D|nr:nucleotide sugar dehydrogenase [Saccharopolyspora erythraea]QUH02665.1 nucleotide sugar dehydrogenase [Saccharopolyspora erythraea]
MTASPLALAVNGREHQLFERLVPFIERNGHVGEPVAVVGLGYVGLPTAYSLAACGARVTGLDTSARRLSEIRAGEVDLPEAQRRGLAEVLESGSLRVSDNTAVLTEADTVIVCVPTPVDEDRTPDLAALRAACESVVSHVRKGQTIILTSTTFVGTTRMLLVEPLRERGLRVGTDVHVAFSPERIDPGNLDHTQRETPRIVGGVTRTCAERAARVIGRTTDSVYLVGSPESAELTKLYENIFRAVNLALANEIADVCRDLDLDPVEVTIAAGTKPYGFLGSFPGPGVGGHCIPCDPHYLLWQLREHGVRVPLIEQAMRSIEHRPDQVVRRVLEELVDAAVPPRGARVLIAGVSYKAGVRDLRESPALPIISGLRRAGVHVSYYDPLIPEVVLEDGTRLQSAPAGQDCDLVLMHTVHPGLDYGWATRCPLVLDATYQFDAAAHRRVV